MTLTANITDDELDDMATAGTLLPVGPASGPGDIDNEDELRALMAGRPNLGSNHATGDGPSARRQVRLPAWLNDQLESYVKNTGQTPSTVIRKALEEYLAA